MEYARLINEASLRFGITKDEARSRYGLLTNKQWEKLLNIAITTYEDNESRHCGMAHRNA